jgi:hypothetical protein
VEELVPMIGKTHSFDDDDEDNDEDFSEWSKVDIIKKDKGWPRQELFFI